MARGLVERDLLALELGNGSTAGVTAERSTASATATEAAATTTTTAVTESATATTSSTTATEATTSTAASSTSVVVVAGSREVGADSTAVNGLSTHTVDGGLGLLNAGELDVGETLAVTGLTKGMLVYAGNR